MTKTQEKLEKFKTTLRLLFSHKMGKAGLIICTLFLLLAIFAPVHHTVDPKRTGDVENILRPPSREFWLGTDDLARDIWSQIIYGSRISLMIGFFAAALAIFIGSLVGLIAGFYGGRIDELLMRIVDLFLMLPTLPLMIVLAAMLGVPVYGISFLW